MHVRRHPFSLFSSSTLSLIFFSIRIFPQCGCRNLIHVLSFSTFPASWSLNILDMDLSWSSCITSLRSSKSMRPSSWRLCHFFLFWDCVISKVFYNRFGLGSRASRRILIILIKIPIVRILKTGLRIRILNCYNVGHLIMIVSIL